MAAASVNVVALLFLVKVVFSQTIEQNPDNQVILTVGQLVEFSCNSPFGHIASVSWQINSTSISELNYSLEYVDYFDNNRMLGTLVIVSIPQLMNESIVHCIVTFDGGTEVGSLGCMITLQGTLAPVGELIASNLNSTSTLISWTAPFTLNISTTPPHIKYCIDVWNTNGLPAAYTIRIYSICDLIATTFIFTLNRSQFNECFKILYIVTPTNRAGNGTASSIYENQSNSFSVIAPTTLSSGDIRLYTVSEMHQVNVTIKMLQLILLCSITMIDAECNASYSFHSTDDVDIAGDNNISMISFSSSDIPFWKKFEILVNASNCAGSSVSKLQLNTFLLQNMTSSEDCQQDNCLLISLLYSEKKANYGAFVILTSYDDGIENSIYFPLINQNETNVKNIEVHSIPVGSYQALVYEISESGYVISGLPTIMTTVSVSKGNKVFPSYSKDCCITTIEFRLVTINCDQLTSSNYNSNIRILGYSVVLQSATSNHIMSGSILGTAIAIFEMQNPGKYNVIVFPIRAYSTDYSINWEEQASVVYKETITVYTDFNKTTTVTSLISGIDKNGLNQLKYYIIIGITCSLFSCTVSVMFIMLSYKFIIRNTLKMKASKQKKFAGPVYEDIEIVKDSTPEKTFQLIENVAYGNCS